MNKKKEIDSITALQYTQVAALSRPAAQVSTRGLHFTMDGRRSSAKASTDQVGRGSGVKGQREEEGERVCVLNVRENYGVCV